MEFQYNPIIPKSLAHAQHTYFTHTGSRRTGLKWASQIIIQIWNITHDQWLHYSKLKHAGYVLDDNTKELILGAEIMNENYSVQDTLL